VVALRGFSLGRTIFGNAPSPLAGAAGGQLYFEAQLDNKLHTSALARVNTAGGTPEILAQIPGTISQMVVGSEFATINYWKSDQTDSVLLQYALATQTSTTVQDKVSVSSVLFANGAVTYFADNERHPPTLSTIETGKLVLRSTFPKEVSTVTSLATDGHSLYWSATSSSSGSINAVGLIGRDSL
jgi:hypothetical protein